jgi:hypothetical protein
MAKDDQQEQFDKLMSANLARVIDFIKFAETKNAALLTFCSAWMLAIVTLLSAQKPIPAPLSAGAELALPFFALGAGAAILSFVPRLSIETISKTKKRGDNLLYFGDISEIPIQEFASAAKAKYLPLPSMSATEAYFNDLSNQVAINSRIAKRKFTMFSWGTRFVFLALFMMAAPSLGHAL